MLKRRREEMLTGDKHDHIIRGLGKLVPIGLARQALDMVFHRLRMARHGNGTDIIVDGVKRVLIIIQRYLGIDDQGTPTGNMDDRIGPQTQAIANINARFQIEIDMLGQAAAFEHIFQLLLAPSSARLGRVAKRIHKPRSDARNTLLTNAHFTNQAL